MATPGQRSPAVSAARKWPSAGTRIEGYVALWMFYFKINCFPYSRSLRNLLFPNSIHNIFHGKFLISSMNGSSSSSDVDSSDSLKIDKLIIIWGSLKNTPETAGGPGGHDLTLDVKSRKIARKSFFFVKDNYYLNKTECFSEKLGLWLRTWGLGLWTLCLGQAFQ